MPVKSMLKRFCLVGILVLSAVAVQAADIRPQKPGPRDKCAVCGMFVAKYPDFAAQIQFRDGKVAFFDGPKDLFTYYQGLARYNPGKKQSDVTAVIVTSYYSLTPVDGRTAWYVIGSDVFGPMGKELVPFATEKEARGFQRDHKGKRVLRFSDITPAVVKELD
jgi:copper chaperone NosL